jgi:hypothetical protein
MKQQSLNLSTLSDLEFHKKVIEGLVGNIWNKISLKQRKPILTAVEDHLKGKLAAPNSGT